MINHPAPIFNALLLVTLFFAMPLGQSIAETPAADTQQETDDDAVARFEKLCALEEGQVIKRVAPPFSPDRLAYYRIKHFRQAEAIPDGPDIMFMHFEDGEVKNWGMTFGGVRLPNVMTMIAQVHRQEIEADEAIKNTELSGDFVFCPQASRDELIEGLMDIARRELDLPWKAEWREVERDAIVVSGEFAYTALLPDDESIHLFGARLNEDGSGGGSSGKFDAFLQGVGDWLDMPVVNEVESPPDKYFVWRYHHGYGFTDEERELAKNADVVLANLNIQTGLNYVVEKRTVRLLFIETMEQNVTAEP